MATDFSKSSERFLSDLDSEISRLQTIRTQVASALGVSSLTKKGASSDRKGMSEEGRRRIAEAQRLRWAAKKALTKVKPKKAAAKKTAVKKRAVKKGTAAASE